MDSYERFHFGPGLLGSQNFAEAVGAFCLRMCEKYGTFINEKNFDLCALDAGCGPGRSAFKFFDFRYATPTPGFEYIRDSPGFDIMNFPGSWKRC